MRRKILEADGSSAIAAYEQAVFEGVNLNPATKATAVRFLLEELAAKHPGNTLEVRVPPFGAVQCLEGPKHSRGTPPNVVECDADVWLQMALGRLSWQEALQSAKVFASGSRADLENLLPLR